MLKAIFVILAALILYWILVRQTPYCTMHAEADKDAEFVENIELISFCNYREPGFKLFESCKPCPKHAVCSGTKMVSLNRLFQMFLGKV